jgi:hypothetical protein
VAGNTNIVSGGGSSIGAGFTNSVSGSSSSNRRGLREFRSGQLIIGRGCHHSAYAMTTSPDHASISVVAEPASLSGADGKARDDLLEQYKLFVEKTHDYWGQVLTTNEFFLKINGIGLSVFGWIATSKTHVPIPVVIVLLMLALVVSFAWLRTITSLGKLNSARHEIIQELERYLPAQPYRFEYQKLYLEPERKYVSIIPLYRLLPVVAASAYFGLAAYDAFGPR